MNKHYDLAVLGAGIFGVYSALHFSRLGMRVILIDEESDPWSKASLVNQARVHTGYHYPRSHKTALMAVDNKQRFIEEHDFAIDSTYQCYYAVDKRSSLTSADQFERFCRKLNIPFQEVFRSDLFRHQVLKRLFLTEESTFDPQLLRQYYLAEVEKCGAFCCYGWKIVEAARLEDQWEFDLFGPNSEVRSFTASAVINATYANINSVNTLLGFDEIPATHEISEVLLVHSSRLQGIGLTVMDGPYISVMPFGLTGLHSLTSVLYTHSAFCNENQPSFSCQTYRSDCNPDLVRNCTLCPVRPKSNHRKMLSQAKLYLKDTSDLVVHGSLYTVKTKLKSAFVDDGRPTDLRVLSKKPFFACVFSGKINSIYEIERLNLNV